MARIDRDKEINRLKSTLVRFSAKLLRRFTERKKITVLAIISLRVNSALNITR